MSSDQECNTLKLIREARNGNVQALDGLLRMHQRMIDLLAGRFYCECISREELTQAGNLGFMHALEHYDTTRHTKLTTYAVPWILGEMRRTLRKIESDVYSLDKAIDGDGRTLYDVLAGDEDLNIQHIDLRLALAKLSTEEQIVICMRYYRDKTQRESAVLLGKSQAQISKMERRALNTLYGLLS